MCGFKLENAQMYSKKDIILLEMFVIYIWVFSGLKPHIFGTVQIDNFCHMTKITYDFCPILVQFQNVKSYA